MSYTHRPLIKSSVLAAVATAVLPISAANAEITYYTNATGLEAAASGAGLSHLYTETFEENTMASPYALLSPPLCGGVANGTFPTGLDAADLCINNIGFGSLMAVGPEPAYWPNITSTVVGNNSEPEQTFLEFGGDGVKAVGLDITGINSFTSNYPDQVEYTIYDTSGGVLATAVWPTPTSETGAFFGVTSTEAIGKLELRGTRFGLDQQEYVDNVQAWGGGIGVPGDTNDDGVVDVTDLVNVVLAWGDCPGCPEDFNGDGVVNVEELIAVILNWS